MIGLKNTAGEEKQENYMKSFLSAKLDNKLPPDNQLFSIKETANYLNISIYQVYKLIQAGRLPAIRTFGPWRVSRAELEKQIKQAVYAAGGGGD